MRGPFTPALLLLAAAGVPACGGPPKCGVGFYPREGSCVAIRSDGGEPAREDAGELDLGFPEPDPPDVGVPAPWDGSVFDGGYTSPPPRVTLGERGRILYRGSAVLTMAADNPFAPGEVYVTDGRVACVGLRGDCAAQAGGASVVETEAVLLPGLVDAHNHLAYNWLPTWSPGRLFADHDEWQASPEYDAFVAPYSANKDDTDRFCAMVQYAELRALASGSTTVFGGLVARSCFRWLVRNAELSTGYNGWASDHVRQNTLGIDTVNATEAAELVRLMGAGTVRAYLIHVAEGLSARAHREWEELRLLGLVRAETVLIHGTALTASDFMELAAAGGKLVWSPSSNLHLYGDTTDVHAASLAGVKLALAPDWTPSGTGTPLGELRYARALTEARWPGYFSDRELLRMATAAAAEVMAVQRWVGTLEVGKYADLLALAVDPSDPYRAVLAARPHDVRLVTLSGVPTYGDPAIVGVMREAPPSCFDLAVCNSVRRVCWDDPPSGPTSPAALAQTITGFYPAGPLSLFSCE